MSGSSQPNTRVILGLPIRLVFLLLLIFAIADRRTAFAEFTLEQKLTGVGGNAVAIAGERIVVGTPAEDSAKGAVHVYRYNPSTTTWVEEQKLIALDGAAGDQFGFSVAIAGDQIAVGAPFDSDNGSQSGSAYVFRYYADTMTWSQEQKITASDGAPNDFFGFSTAIAGNRVVIGSPLDDDKASRSGAVYVYRFNIGTTTWVEEQKLVASDGVEEDTLGISVAIEGERIVAGAIQTNNCQCQPGRFGSAYVFGFASDSGNWAFEAKLIPPDGMAGDSFGNSVSITGDRIIVGTGFADYAYVFRRNNATVQWVTEQKLVPLDGTRGIEFGSAVAMAGDQVVVGAPRSNSDRGAAYFFRNDPDTGIWVQEQILTGTEASTRLRFGQSVAIAVERIVAGEPGSAAAYIFRFTPDSDGDGVPDAQDECPNSDIRATVIVDGCDSGVGNGLLTEPAGCTITDQILNLAVTAQSHGQFVSQVDKFLMELQKAEILESNEKNAIKDCAAQSTLP